MVTAHTLPSASAATRLVVSDRRSGARSACTRARAAAGEVSGSPVIPAAAACMVPSTSSRSSPRASTPKPCTPTRRGSALDHPVRLQVGRLHGRRVAEDLQHRSRVLAAVEGLGLGGQQVVRLRVGRVGDQVAGLQGAAVGAAVDRDPVRHVEGGGHLGQQIGVGAREHRAERGRPTGRHHLGPGQPSPPSPQVQDTGRDAGHGHGRRADLVRDRLTDEHHLDRLSRVRATGRPGRGSTRRSPGSGSDRSRPRSGWRSRRRRAR